MRIATFNINGIRAAQRRGFDHWLATRGCDVVALQEVRCPEDKLPQGWAGDYCASHDLGSIAGRNGVAILTREQPTAVRDWACGVSTRGLKEFAHEGRYVEVDLADAPLTVASLYLPKGALPAHLQKPGRMREAPDGGAKYERKMRFLDAFARHVDGARRQALRQGREFLLLGDFNIAPAPADVNNWRRQQQSQGFLPEEREWFAAVTGRRLHDVVRRLHPGVQGPYSWWSWLGNSFSNDTGWRIDHHLATPGLARAATRAQVDREPRRDARLSDHAAVVVDYAIGA